LFCPEGKENLEWRQIHQDILLEEFYPRNKKKNRSQLPFYQEQYRHPKGITRYTTKNY